MRRMGQWLVVLLCIATALPGHAQGISRDLDDVYQKTSGSTWGEASRHVLGGSDFGRSYALVIGISDYSYWPYLDASFVDAKRVRDFLIQDAGFDYVHTLTNAKATRARIDELMQEFFPQRLGKGDRFLFYFSGHGTQRATHRGMMGYLPLVNAERQGYASMISMDDVDRWARLLGYVRQTLFVLDACFSGLAGVQKKGPLSNKTLARLSQYGHHLITAGTADEESVASIKLWGGSLFTDAFLRGASGRADASTPEYPADGVVSLKELLEYIRHRIDFESQKNRIRMSPQISDLDADNAGEFFFLARTPPIADNRQTEEPASATALTKGTTPGDGPTPPAGAAKPTPSEIAQAQKLLAQLGYKPGPANGSLGPRTRAAVEAYQSHAGLPVDGAITPGLLASLLGPQTYRGAVARTAPDVNFGSYYALVIGNNDYQHLAKLETPVGDAIAISQILSSKYGFEVTTLLNANRYQILSEMNKMKEKIDENDNLLIYYAGHGELDKVNQRDNWLPVNAEPDSKANWIPYVHIIDIINATSAKHILVISDSCYTGSYSPTSGYVLSRPQAGLSEEARRNWIRSMATQKSRTALTSGRPDCRYPVLGLEGVNHSIFARVILEVLASNLDVLEGQRLFQAVSARMAVIANSLKLHQVPEYAPVPYAGHGGGEFFFPEPNG